MIVINMISANALGHICLNTALVLYLIHYIPQLKHNCEAQNRRQINIHFHGLLSISYLTDLIFAFGMNMPWQYCLVSCTGVVCLITQHIQIKKTFQHDALYHVYQGMIVLFSILFMFSLYLKLPQPFFMTMGYITQLTIWTYTLPQIWQNHLLKQGNGLNPLYLGMNASCYGLDMIASVTLNWPLPAKMGAVFGFACMLILIGQKMLLYSQRASTVYNANDITV